MCSTSGRLPGKSLGGNGNEHVEMPHVWSGMLCRSMKLPCVMNVSLCIAEGSCEGNVCMCMNGMMKPMKRRRRRRRVG